jgi:hypothetical protein
MKLRAIPFQKGILFVDVEGEKKDGDIVYDSINEFITPKINEERAVWFNLVKERNQYFKIIAQHNLSLENIPHMELEEGIDIDKIALDNGWSQSGSWKDGYLTGYKTAQPKKYTEDDLRNAIDMGLSKWMNREKGTLFTTIIDEVIQSLQPNITSVEVETEVVPDYNSYSGGNGEIFTTNKKEQCIRYEKEGKTFIKVKKINYE